MVSLQHILSQAEIDHIQAAIAIQTRTQESLEAVQMRLRRWLKGKPPALPIVERDLSIIGWRLKPEPLPEKNDLAKAKADYLRIAGLLKTAKREAGPMLRSKALLILAGIREDMAGECKPPDMEALEWWLECDLVGTIEWWWDYYRQQAIRAQIADAEGWASIGKARYALTVIKRLEQGRSGKLDQKKD